MKAAHTFETIAERQRSLATHTIGMQFLLDCVRTVVRDLYAVELPEDLQGVEGTINASTPATEAHKHFSVIIRRPVRTKLIIHERLNAKTGIMSWQISCADETIDMSLSGQDTGFAFVPHPTARRSRGIDLDDESH